MHASPVQSLRAPSPLLASLALLAACRSPDPAPDRFEELLGWMFAHAEDEDPAPLAEGAVNAMGWLDNHFDETLSGYVIEPLTEDQLAVIDADGRDRAGLRGVALGYPYQTDLDAVAEALMVRRANAMADTADTTEVTLVDGDIDCFSAGDCARISFDVDQLTDLGFGITLETWMRYEYRRVDTEVGQILTQRNWTTQTPEITTDLFSVLQTYQMWALLPEGDGYRSIQGQWVEAKVGDSGLDMDFVMKIWINGLIDAELNLDEDAMGEGG